VPANVIEEVARRELRRHNCGAGAHSRRPTATTRVGVKQRHRHVAGVLLGKDETLGQRKAGDRGHQLRNQQPP